MDRYHYLTSQYFFIHAILSFAQWKVIGVATALSGGSREGMCQRTNTMCDNSRQAFMCRVALHQVSCRGCDLNSRSPYRALGYGTANQPPVFHCLKKYCMYWSKVKLNPSPVPSWLIAAHASTVSLFSVDKTRLTKPKIISYIEADKILQEKLDTARQAYGNVLNTNIKVSRNSNSPFCWSDPGSCFTIFFQFSIPPNICWNIIDLYCPRNTVWYDYDRSPKAPVCYVNSPTMLVQ